MQKILLLLCICFLTNMQLFAQKQDIISTISVFPYQQVKESDKAIAVMQTWTKTEWKPFLLMLDNDSLKLKASYALRAYTNTASLDPQLKKQAAIHFSAGLSEANSYYARDIIIQHLGLLGDDEAIKSLSKLLKDETYSNNAAMALASIHSDASKAALQQALKKAKLPYKKNIQAALDNSNMVLPSIKSSQNRTGQSPFKNNDEQRLLDIQDEMDKAKNPIEKKGLLNQAARINGICSFMFVRKSLNDPDLKNSAANVLAQLALADKNIRGEEVRATLEKSLPLLKGEDSAFLSKKLLAHLKAMPYDNGFKSLFNGKDLTGWKGLVGNPISRAKMSLTELADAQMKSDKQMQNDWVVKDGLLVFTGHGENLATINQYADFDMYVDWKITEKGDAGIYLRGSPQVQIWDTSRREVGAQVGSGGLYNNQKNESKPIVVADNKIGEWNTFHIIMRDDKVTVYLNGILVTDKIVLENYWDRKLPIFLKEQIELQAHGTYVAYRNIYLREIPISTIAVLNEEEKKEGFIFLYDGSNMDQWVGNTAGYLSEEGAIVVHPELSGGNLYSKEEYADFVYRFEFQLTPGANNGIGIRAPLEGDAAYVGMEIQVLDNEAEKYKSLQVYQYHGSVYGVVPAKRGFLKPIGEWNKEEIMIKGTKIRVVLNDETILDADLKEAIKNGTIDHNAHPGLARTTGHIGFLGHGDVVRFRNIRIKKI